MCTCVYHLESSVFDQWMQNFQLDEEEKASIEQSKVNTEPQNDSDDSSEDSKSGGAEPAADKDNSKKKERAKKKTERMRKKEEKERGSKLFHHLKELIDGLNYSISNNIDTKLGIHAATIIRTVSDNTSNEIEESTDRILLSGLANVRQMQDTMKQTKK